MYTKCHSFKTNKMSNYFRCYIFFSIFMLLIFSCTKDKIEMNKKVQIAFIADIHLQDIYGSNNILGE